MDGYVVGVRVNYMFNYQINFVVIIRYIEVLYAFRV